LTTKMKSNGKMHHTQVGTDACMAPEIEQGHGYDAPGVDVFALGVTLFVMITGRYPFINSADGTYKRFQANPKGYVATMGVKISREALDLVTYMTTEDPYTRYTLSHVKFNKWWKGGPTLTADKVKENFMDQRAGVKAPIPSKSLFKEVVINRGGD